VKQTMLKIFGFVFIVFGGICLSVGLFGCGAGGLSGYSNQWPYPSDVCTVYVEMFDTGGFRRGFEYKLTDAICKRIESETPYKIVSDRNLADTILSGQISTGSYVLAVDRFTGSPLENEAFARVSVNWKNLETGELLISNEQVVASSNYSAFFSSQSFDSSVGVALNRAAQRVVELMQEKW